MTEIRLVDAIAAVIRSGSKDRGAGALAEDIMAVIEASFVLVAADAPSLHVNANGGPAIDEPGHSVWVDAHDGVRFRLAFRDNPPDGRYLLVESS